MSRSLFAAIDSLAVQHAIAATRPTTAIDGVDVTGWRTRDRFSGPLAAVFLDGDAAVTIGAPTGGSSGPELWGYRFGQWWRVGYLNDGQDVAVAANLQGYVQAVNTIGIFERLCIAGTVTGGTATAKFVPIDSWESPS